MRQFAIVVEAKRLDPPLLVFIQLNLMFDHLHARFENTFILDCLANFDLARASAL